MIQVLKTSRTGIAGSIRIVTLLPKIVQVPPIIVVPPAPQLLVNSPIFLQIKRPCNVLCSMNMRVTNLHQKTANLLIAIGFGVCIKGDFCTSIRNLVRNTFTTSYLIHRLRLQCSAAIHIRVHENFTRQYSSLQHARQTSPSSFTSTVRIYKVLLEQNHEFIN